MFWRIYLIGLQFNRICLHHLKIHYSIIIIQCAFSSLCSGHTVVARGNVSKQLKIIIFSQKRGNGKKAEIVRTNAICGFLLESAGIK